jgi:Flp pilus assembly protein TadB
VVRDRKRAAVLITDAPEDPERELRRREIRYVTMMALRAACLVVAAIIASTRPPLWGLWVVLCLVAMVLLPWFAVLLANDRPAKKHQPPTPAAETVPGQPALPAPRHRTIDADL